MKSKSLTIQVHPDDVKINTYKDIISIEIHSEMGISVEFDNSVLLKSQGDFMIAAKGEIDFISYGKPICLESINSEIHLNSREAAPIKNEPDSIEYRKNLKIENKQNIQIATMQEMQNKTLKERVSILENKLDEIGFILKEFNQSMGGK